MRKRHQCMPYDSENRYVGYADCAREREALGHGVADVCVAGGVLPSIKAWHHIRSITALLSDNPVIFSGANHSN